MNFPSPPKRFSVGTRTLFLAFVLVIVSSAALVGALHDDERVWSLIDPGAVEVGNNFAIEPTDATEKPLTWWLTRDYLALNPPPDVVIFGSSQIGGMRSADANTAGKKLDITQDHRGYLLEKLLKEQTGTDQKVFIAQHPGTLVSDFLVMSQVWFNHKLNQPKMVVLTLTARDFLSDSRPYIGSSAAFRSLSQYANLGDLTWIIYPNLQSRLNWLVRERIAPRMFQSSPTRPNNLQNRSEIPKGTGGTDFSLSRGQIFFEGEDKQKYLKMDYPEKAYEKPDYHFSKQLQCFEKLLEFLHQKQIKTFIVGTPLYPADRAEIDKQCWSRFAPQISNACKQNQAQFLDLTDSNYFLQRDFLDPVHLGLKGGTKLADEIAKMINAHN